MFSQVSVCSQGKVYIPLSRQPPHLGQADTHWPDSPLQLDPPGQTPPPAETPWPDSPPPMVRFKVKIHQKIERNLGPRVLGAMRNKLVAIVIHVLQPVKGRVYSVRYKSSLTL